MKAKNKLAIGLGLACAAVVAEACTGFYVGRQVSASGDIVIARTVDTAPWTSIHRFEITERVENVPGRIYNQTPEGFQWKLPATTWRVVSTPRITALLRGSMHSACANERGFIISGTVTAGPNGKIRELDPYVKTGAGENSLPGLLALSCATAREALDLMGEVIAKSGHTNGEIYMFADKDEAWYVEVYSGHQWAAVRMPEDRVACFGNQFMIQSFDPDSAETRHSPELISLVEKAGLLVRGADGKPDLIQSYCGGHGDYANYRTWYGHHVLAPATAGDYKTAQAMPLFFAPEKKVSVRDIIELSRTRYEGSGCCPDETGNKTIRTIGTTKQATCHVITLDPRLPARYAGTVWATLANAEHAPYLPLNAALGALEPAYSLDRRTGDFFDARLAACHYRRLASLAEKDRAWYGAGVRAHWTACEENWLKAYPKILAAAAAQDSPKDLTAWTLRVQRSALADAKRIFDDLTWYVTANNRISGDGSGATDLPPAPFKVRPPAAPKTKVLFFFDTEDYTDDESNDAILAIAELLRAEGVRGHFACASEVGNFLVEKKRTDVIAALKHHLIGSQTFYHSKHPTINEYADIPDYAEAYRRTKDEEGRGFEVLKRTLGTDRVWCSVFPGPSNSYVGLYVHSELGSTFFGGGNGSFVPGEREAAWYANQFHLPYYKKFHLESFIPPNPAPDYAARLDELARHEIVTLYMHPHMANHTRHWDSVNLKPGEEVPWGQWKKAPARRPVDVAVYYDRFRTLVHALVTDLRFDVTDCERLEKTFAPRVVLTEKDIPAVRAALLARLAPLRKPGSLCVADVFQACVAFLRGEKEFSPGRVYGFLENPTGVTTRTELRREDLVAAARGLDLTTFIPSEIAVGGAKVGPADFLFAALETLETGAATVTVEPRADQLGPISVLMPNLSTYSTAGRWGIYHADYKDRYMTPRLRLQLWTLRYE